MTKIYTYRKGDDGYVIMAGCRDTETVQKDEASAIALCKRMEEQFQRSIKSITEDAGWSGFDQFPEDDGEPTNAPDASASDKEAEGLKA